jgi:hypothetical protein
MRLPCVLLCPGCRERYPILVDVAEVVTKADVLDLSEWCSRCRRRIRWTGRVAAALAETSRRGGLRCDFADR